MVSSWWELLVSTAPRSAWSCAFLVGGKQRGCIHVTLTVYFAGFPKHSAAAELNQKTQRRTHTGEREINHVYLLEIKAGMRQKQLAGVTRLFKAAREWFWPLTLSHNVFKLACKQVSISQLQETAREALKRHYGEKKKQELQQRADGKKNSQQALTWINRCFYGTAPGLAVQYEHINRFYSPSKPLIQSWYNLTMTQKRQTCR